MSHSTPANKRNPSNRLVQLSNRGDLLEQFFRGNPVALNGAAAVISDTEILQPEFAGGFGHFFECIVTVACHRVAMKRAAQIFFLDELWQGMLFGRFKLAAVFT